MRAVPICLRQFEVADEIRCDLLVTAHGRIGWRRDRAAFGDPAGDDEIQTFAWLPGLAGDPNVSFRVAWPVDA